MSSAPTPVQLAASTMAQHGAAVRAANQNENPTGNFGPVRTFENLINVGLPKNRSQWNSYLKTLAGFVALTSRARKALVKASRVIAVLNNDNGRHGRIGDVTDDVISDVKDKDLWDPNYSFKAEINFQELPDDVRSVLEWAIQKNRGQSYKHYGKAASKKINAAGKTFRATMASKNKLTDEEKRAKRRARDAARRQRERDAKKAKLAAMTPEEREAYEQEELRKKESRKQALAEKREAHKQAEEEAKFQQHIAGLSMEQLQAMIAEKQALQASI